MGSIAHRQRDALGHVEEGKRQNQGGVPVNDPRRNLQIGPTMAQTVESGALRVSDSGLEDCS